LAQDAFSNFDPLRAIERLFFTNLRPGQAHLSLLTHAGISFYSGRAKSGLLHFMFPGARQYAWVVLCSSPGWRLMRGYVPKMRCVLYAFPKGMTAGFAVSDGLWQINQIPTMPW